MAFFYYRIHFFIYANNPIAQKNTGILKEVLYESTDGLHGVLRPQCKIEYGYDSHDREIFYVRKTYEKNNGNWQWIKKLEDHSDYDQWGNRKYRKSICYLSDFPDTIERIQEEKWDFLHSLLLKHFDREIIYLNPDYLQMSIIENIDEYIYLDGSMIREERTSIEDLKESEDSELEILMSTTIWTKHYYDQKGYEINSTHYQEDKDMGDFKWYQDSK